jgi:ribulose-phosphate 3-epimerase
MGALGGRCRRDRAGNVVGVPPASPLIVPSVLAGDFSRLGEVCRELEQAGADRLQWDVMDGQFVPNLTFGADVIAACRRWTALPFEAHLMVHEPDLLVPRFVEAGCDVVIVHAESVRHQHRSLAAVADLGARAAVALNPATPAVAVEHVLDLVDMVLVMTVNPGFGGQSYLSSMEPKIRDVRALVERCGRPIGVEVDGGISSATAGRVTAAGADVLVAGSALFRDPDGLAHAVTELRASASAGMPSPPAGPRVGARSGSAGEHDGRPAVRR